MRSPFLVVRLTFFSLLLYLNVLQLIFAAWNISAVSEFGLSVPGTQAFLLFNSCAGLILFIAGLIPLAWPQYNLAHLAYECTWCALLSFLQLAAAIGSTVSGSAMLQIPDWAVTASAFLLLPTSWLISLLQLAYFIVILLVASIHSRSQQDIWTESIYTIKWFNFSNLKVKTKDIGIPRPKTGYEADSWTRHLEDIESTAALKVKYPVPVTSEKPAWANNAARRGVDPPFARKDDYSSPRSSITTRDEQIKLPAKAEVPAATSFGSRFIERFRESQTISRPPNNINMFPHEVEDHDQPIPLTRFSRWIRADTMKSFMH